MNNNIPYFSAIFRHAIVERIMLYAGEDFTLENFYAKDSDAFGANTFRFSKDGVSTEGLNIAEYYCSARCVREADRTLLQAISTVMDSVWVIGKPAKTTEG